MVNRRHGQVMLHLGLLEAGFKLRPLAIWSDGTRLKVLVPEGEFRPEITPSAEYHLNESASRVFDAFVQVNRTSLERIEDVERGLAELEQDALHAPPLKVLELKQKLADVREELGRAITAVADLAEGGLLPVLGGSEKALHSVEQELLRLRDLTQATQSALTDIFMIRQTEQANQLQVVANRMSAVSNRIAELANISNIRMLGLSYVMLILAVMTSVIVFPNTAATILGMPSAANVPGWLVAYVLIFSTIIPMYYFFRQRWIRDLFRGMKGYEARVEEGFGRLTENIEGVDIDYNALEARAPPKPSNPTARKAGAARSSKERNTEAPPTKDDGRIPP
ncbi:MAG: hypothetical protein KGJ23_14630 [Euryarchaeota archaeon]|nr:hypothetical protein [Euryarchaeota archaeon]MDE1880110.1 hypothetical protein [Euryarchaeota archaeon]MDE2045052.1 hypothetical protein [Thermoplasmata archaeon]